MRLTAGTIYTVTNRENQDAAIERHFMRALKVELAGKGLTNTQAEEIAGIPGGTISLWMRGKRMPSALRFAEVAMKLGIDPGALVNEGVRRAREAGLLDEVEVLPLSDEALEDD